MDKDNELSCVFGRYGVKVKPKELLLNNKTLYRSTKGLKTKGRPILVKGNSELNFFFLYRRV